MLEIQLGYNLQMNGHFELIDLYTYQSNNLRMKINNLFLVAFFRFNRDLLTTVVRR